MKNFTILFLFVLYTPSFAQMQSWEYVSHNNQNPFPASYYNFKDSKGNFWIDLYRQPQIIKYDKYDTVTFDLPRKQGSAIGRTIFTNAPDDRVALAFSYEKDENGVVENYLGIYNDTSFKFYSNTEMNLPISNMESISEVANTRANIWIRFDTKIVRFNRGTTFEVYNENNELFNNIGNTAQLLSDDSLEVFILSNGELYSFQDGATNWKKINIPDSISSGEVDKAGHRIFLFGRTKFYIYKNGGINSYDLPDSPQLGKREEQRGYYWPGADMFYSGNLWIIWYEKGMVTLDNGTVNTFFYSDYIADDIRFFFNPQHIRMQENGIVTFKKRTFNSDEWRYTNYHFSYKANSLKLEEIDNTYISSIYKDKNGDVYLTKGMERNLVIIKNKKDTTLLTVPKGLYIGDIRLDDNFLWIIDDTNGVNQWTSMFRMRRDLNLFKGRIYYDNNRNGVQNIDEIGISRYPLTISPSGIKVFPSEEGNFSFSGNIGENYIMTLPAGVNVNYSSKPLPFTLSDLSSNNIIGITLSNTSPEARSNFYLPWPRCNTTSNAAINLKNTGFEPIQKARILLVSDSKAVLASDEQGKINHNGDTLIIEVNNLMPGKTDSLKYSITWPAAERIGDQIHFRLEVSLFASGTVVKNIKDSMSTVLRCSFDPNDKSVTPAGVGSKNYTLKDIDLSYQIRFENTGNDTAYHVTIYDTLDPNLDHSTFQYLGSSHSVSTSVSPTGKVVFFFENIMLPDSSANKEKAQGFVRYRIAPKMDIPDFTPITNVAGIVFDSNKPIITNTVSNVMVTSLEGLVPISKSKVSNITSYCFPNPAREHVNIKVDDFSYAEIFDYWGRSIFTADKPKLNISELSIGIYLVKIYGKDGVLIQTEKLIKN